jgi:hypothetical protein
LPSSKEFQEKVDVLDILISILRDHEESLSKITERFDTVCNDLSSFEEKASVLDRVLEHLGGQKIRTIIGATGTKGPLVTVNCKSWPSFKGASQGSLLVTYEVIGEQAFFYSVSDLYIFTFSGELNETMMSMNKGVKRWIEKSYESDEDQIARAHAMLTSEGNMSVDGDAAYKTVINSKTVRRWLSAEIGIPENKIVEGRVIS